MEVRAPTGEVTQLGLPVPEGFVVSTAAGHEKLARGPPALRLPEQDAAALTALEDQPAHDG